jgi:hypothetical protein
MIRDLINEFGYAATVVGGLIVGFAVMWWVKEIGDFLINN